MPRRLPCRANQTFHEALLQRSLDGAGVRLRFHSSTATLSLGVDPCLDMAVMEPKADWTLDLYVDGQLFKRLRTPRQPAVHAFQGWDAGEHTFEFYADVLSPMRFTGVWIDSDALVSQIPDPRPRWLVYGSSITQCGQAAGPGETWPAIVGREAGLNHINLGFGGMAALDNAVARLMAKLPADLISVCFSVNNYAAYTPRTFRAAVLGFIQTIRDYHPHTPMACVSPIWSEPRETQASETRLALPFMRKEVGAAVKAMIDLGDRRLAYVNGLELFGPRFAALMPDSLHPDAQGCRALAQEYLQRVIPRLRGLV
jgi:hypothetical protein